MKTKLNARALKKTTVFTSLSACVFLTLGLVFTFIAIQPSVSDCEQTRYTTQNAENGLPHSIQCANNGNEVSWLAWVTSKSTSNQFHFLDLLELLSQIGPEEK